MGDATSSSEPPLVLSAVSGREWRLQPVRRLNSSVQLVRDASRPSAPPLALKTIYPNSDATLRALLDDLPAWRRAHTAEPDFLLAPLDVATTSLPSASSSRQLHVLTHFYPAGDLSASAAAGKAFPRAERPALRFVAALATAVEALLAAAGASAAPPAHAAISLEHVFLDRAGAPRLAGYGLTRHRNLALNPRPTERGDVVALARILFHLLFGTPFNSSSGIPDSPVVSAPTRDLLADVLQRGSVKILSEFRYDLAAARRLVPVCAPPLAPVVNRRREQLLDADLDSNRGLHDTPSEHRNPSQYHLPSHQSPQQQGSSSRAPQASPAAPMFETPHPRAAPLAVPKPRSVQHVAQPHEGTDPSAVDAARGTPASAGNGDVPTTFANEAAVDSTVRTIANGDLTAVPTQLMEALVMSTTPAESPIGEQIFKTLFRLPISKNPVVAAKAAMFLHHLIADGPAKLTSQCLANDGFLQWVEAAWSRDRLQNRPGKAHGYAYCFAGGEIGTYVAMLRRRIATHAKFLDIVTTHWLIRISANGGSPSITDAQRRDLGRMVLEIIEQASALARKFAAARDPAAQVKTAAVPGLMSEIAKSYHVFCWLVSTASEALARDMIPELGIAHAAAHGAMLTLRGDPALAERCPPLALLDLTETPPTPASIDPVQVIAVLKKMKKRKKKRRDAGPELRTNTVKTESNGHSEKVEPDTATTPGIEEYEDKAEQKEPEVLVTDVKPGRRRAMRTDASSEDEPAESVSSRRPPPRDNVVHDAASQLVRRSAPLAHEKQTEEPVNGLRKLSLSVRRDGMQPPVSARASRFAPPNPEEVRTNGQRNRFEPVEQEQEPARPHTNGRTSRDFSDEGRARPVSHVHRGKVSDETSESSDDDSNRRRRHSSATPSREDGGRRASRKHSPRRKRSQTESESEDDVSERSSVSKRRNGTKARSKSRRDNEKSDARTDENERVETKKNNGKHHSDERKIPFGKGPRNDQSSQQNGGGHHEMAGDDDDYSGGSKEALAAAAQGRKTPKMNSAFEVAPYEVHFGPQIGSGGFGVVYKAKFRNETVAVKKIHGHALSNAASVGEFQSEVAVLCTLRHPNILRFVGACTKPPNLMIITEFMARGTLFDLLHQSQTRVTWPMRKKFALDTCKGMRYLHDSKLLHRDLKSSNLMLDKDLNCKVGDFGLTRISKGAAAVQMTGQCGTFQYMAVEVLANKPYSEKADVFSFGILLWEMVARKLPYFGMQPMQVGIAVVQQGLRPTIPPRCPAPLSNLMQACWDNEPTRRPSFAQLVETLEAMPE